MAEIGTVYKTDIKAFDRTKYGVPIIILSTNDEILHNIEIFDAASKLMGDIQVACFKSAFSNLSYNHILAEIAYGNGIEIGAIEIRDKDYSAFKDAIDGSEKKIVIFNKTIYGSSVTMPCIIFPEIENEEDDQFQYYIIEFKDIEKSLISSNIPSKKYNKLDRFTSIKINRLAPNTAFYFYPVLPNQSKPYIVSVASAQAEETFNL